MAKQHHISSAVVLAKVYRDFKPTASNWDIDAIEWIGDALGIMQLSIGTVKRSCNATVKNYKCKLPCTVDSLNFITDSNNCLINPINSHVLIDKAKQYYENKVGDIINEAQSHYQLNGNFVHFSFSDGDITFHYNSLPVDEDGFPMIPKDSMILQAISWYIVRALCLRGMVHPVVTFPMANQLWEEYYPRAQNRSKRMTPEQRSMFSKSWLSIVPNLSRRETFYTDYYINVNNQNNNIQDFLGTTIPK